MNIPPLPALDALDTLARTGSVTRTAEHLSLSQSAVSHKLKALEARLGFALTETRGRSVVLTPEARRYVEAIRPALAALQQAHRGVGGTRGALEVAVTSGLAATWLVPRLRGFLSAYPEVSLTLRSVTTTEEPPSFDLWIGFSDAPPAAAERLQDVQFFPVCSPDFLYRREGLSPDSLDAADLLHLDNRTDWAAWLGAAHSSVLPGTSGLMFTGLLAMYAAAEAGLGMCLGDRLTCAHALASGRLVRPFETEIAARAGYWCLSGPGGPSAPAQAFADWVKVEIRQGVGAGAL